MFIPAHTLPFQKSNYGVALLDRLTKSVLGIPTPETELKPQKLKEHFEGALYELFLLKSRLQEKCSQMEVSLYKWCLVLYLLIRWLLTYLRQLAFIRS